MRAAGVKVDILKSRAQTGGLKCQAKGNASACLAEISASGLFGSLSRFVSLEDRNVSVNVAGTLQYMWKDAKGTPSGRTSALQREAPARPHPGRGGVRRGRGARADLQAPARVPARPVGLSPTRRLRAQHPGRALGALHRDRQGCQSVGARLPGCASARRRPPDHLAADRAHLFHSEPGWPRGAVSLGRARHIALPRSNRFGSGMSRIAYVP